MTEFRIDQLLGREVHGPKGERVGRIEEFRAGDRAGHLTIDAFVIGTAGLLERLGLALNRLVGRRTGGRVARWDQLDLSDPARPRLTCTFEELEQA